MKKKVAIDTLRDSVMVLGKLSVKTKRSEVANAVYMMDGYSVKPYK